MPGVAASLKVVFSADTASYTASVKAAKQQLGVFEKSAADAGKTARASMADARGSVMVLGEEFGVHLPRHVQRFIATLPGVQSALSAAFSGVAVLAIGVAIFKTGEKIYEFAQKNEEAARKNAEAFRGVNSSIIEANDSLTVTNDKLAESIAKFEHKPENGLKLAIDEAIDSADSLGRKLDEDLAKMAGALKGNGVGVWSQLFTGGASTDDLEKKFQDLQDRIQQTTAEGSAKVRSLYGGKPEDIAAAQNALDDKLAVLYREGANFAGDVLKSANYARAAQADRAAGGHAYPESAISGFNAQNMDARIRGASGMLSFFGGQADSMQLSRDNAALTKQNDIDNAAAQAARDAAKAWSAEFEKEMKAVPERIKLLVDTPTKERERRDRVFKSTLGAPTEPAGGFKDVAGDMDQDLGRYGPKWKEFNKLLAENSGEQTKLSTQLALTKLHIEETTGAIGPHAAALKEAQLHASQYTVELEELQQELKAILADGTLSAPDRETQAQKVRNQIGALGGQNQVQSAEDQARIAATSTLGEFRDKLMKTIDDFTNLGNAISDVVIRGLDEFNATVIKVLSTPANVMRGRHPFDQLGASVAESAGGAALRYGEGSAMKAMGNIPGLNKLFADNEKLGSQANPMWVKLAPGAAALDAASAGAISKLFPSGGGSSGGGAGSSIVSFAMGAAGFPHFAGGGAIPANMPAIVGENGPEMLLPRNPGVIVPNGKFGGSTVVNNFHFDNRGAGDPAAVEAASRRAVLGAAPHMIAAAKASIQDENRRRPASRGR